MTGLLELAETLERAADLLAGPGAWTQGSWARDAAGHAVTLWSDDATCFCMRGALVRASRRSMSSEMTDIQKPLGFSTASAMARWNDRADRTQAQVVGKLVETAAHLRATPSESSPT